MKNQNTIFEDQDLKRKAKTTGVGEDEDVVGTPYNYEGKAPAGGSNRGDVDEDAEETDNTEADEENSEKKGSAINDE